MESWKLTYNGGMGAEPPAETIWDRPPVNLCEGKHENSRAYADTLFILFETYDFSDGFARMLSSRLE